MNILDFFRMLFKSKAKLPLILQSEAAECGLVCLAMVAGYHGYQTDLQTLREQFSFSLRGVNLKNIVDTARTMNLSTRAVRIELDGLSHLTLPAILHWKMTHFVVLKEVNIKLDGTLKSVVIHDPALGLKTFNADIVSECFTGVALQLNPTKEFVRKKNKHEISITKLIAQVNGLHGALFQILVLALALELFALTTPFFMQLVVDASISSTDKTLLTTLAIGFCLLLILQTSLSFLRSWMLLYLSTHLNLQWLSNVFIHLLKLPMNYFEKRHLGDVLSRFGSIQTIQKTLTNSFVEVFLDGLLAITTFCMMLAYSKILCLIVLLFVIFYALLRFALYAPLRRTNEEYVNLSAREQSLLMESIRGIQAIKLFNHENARHQLWQNALVDSTNSGLALQKMSLYFSTGHKFLTGLENILVITCGAILTMENIFSIGMLYAFISYKTTFTTRVYSLMDKWMDLKMLAMQGERLADIALTAPEQMETSITPHQIEAHISIEIECKNLSFRYGEFEPWVLRNLNLKIYNNESIALIGSSGSGKTTLMKLLLGLIAPTEGEILVNGIPMTVFGMQRYRKIVGAVMQDDQLFSGSIIENISFFDDDPDQIQIIRCAKVAAIAEDIQQMPMNYQTLIGDMGTTLSGGQKQRLLLARALYKNPSILFLDEATSHLDVKRESAVNLAIRKLNVTRVIVAHREETIRSAHRVVELMTGRIVRDSQTLQSKKYSEMPVNTQA